MNAASSLASILMLLVAPRIAHADDAPKTWGTSSATPEPLPPPKPPPPGTETPEIVPAPTPQTQTLQAPQTQSPTTQQIPQIQVDSRPPLGIFPSHEDKLMDPRMARSWGEGATRWFVASTIDVGFVYARPRVSLGYGKPFTKWIGIDANPIATTDGLGAYGGIRLEVPYFDLRVGPRYFFSFNRSYLAPEASYNRVDVDSSGGKQAQLVTYEVEADSQIPLGPGSINLRGSLSYVDGVPSGFYAFEETLKVVVDPPLVWRGRGGYLLRFGSYQQHSIGIVADVLGVPKRDEAITVRVGPVLRIVLSRRVEVRGSFVATVASPDRLGLEGSDFTELGVRYRWATE